MLQALEFRICDGRLGISPRNTASHEGGRAVVHMEVPMSPAPRQSVPLPTMETDTTQIVGRTGNAARAGIQARSAVSVAQVPFGACVEIDMIAELRATQVGGRI